MAPFFVNHVEVNVARPFDFNHAIVRAVPRSLAGGLRAVDSGAPDFAAAVAEHAAYMRALKEAGAAVDVLPALDEFPDSVFVEDTALTFREGAIVLRPGAPSRRGESEEIVPALKRRFARVLRLENGSVDGGDVLVTPRGVFIGTSARTDARGAEALTFRLSEFGHQGFVVETPPGVLHLKSDCALLDEETVLVTARLKAAGAFDSFRTIVVPEGEEAAANAVRVNDVVLVNDAFPRTRAMLDDARYRVLPLAVREMAKLDAGLSCMSLRWHA